MNLAQTEAELKKRLAYPETRWGRVQNDQWDRDTRFVYRTYDWNDLIKKIDGRTDDFKSYAINRWFNFWSAKQVEAMFCSFPGVTKVDNPYDRNKDFCFKALCFDHKTSVFPKRYPNDAKFAYHNRGHLIEWLYLNQSQQGRFHLKNRLFVILFDRDGQHWQLKAELGLIYAAVESYMIRFDPSRLYRVNIDGNEALSDLIWVVR